MCYSSDVGVVGECTLSHPPAARRSVDPVIIRVSIFFDGTNNNRTNITQRETGTISWWTRYFTPSPFTGSYRNDYSNVSTLETHFSAPRNTETNVAFSIYVPGIGTNDGGRDYALGMAGGEGPTGVMQRVHHGIQEIVDGIVERVTSRNRPIEIILDAFGFSRGAAAARFFIYQVLPDVSSTHLSLEARLEAESLESPYEVLSVRIKFVGLFDTVAAHGLHHHDDVVDLHLEAISHAEKVVQLAAADEHRLNFPLTNIESAGTNGLEIFLPGVHSDIGGGYPDYNDEPNLVVSQIGHYHHTTATLMDQMDELIADGWWWPGELTIAGNQLIGNRAGIRNTYKKISLSLMAGYAHDMGGLQFGDQVYNTEGVNAVKREIDNYIAWCGRNSDPSHWRRSHWPSPSDVPGWLRNLRHHCFHFSSFYGGAGDVLRPQFYSEGPEGDNWDDSMINRMYGERRRRIYDG